MFKQSAEKTQPSGLIVSSVIGGVVAMVMTLTLLFLGAVLISAELISERVGEEIILVSAILSVTVGAVIAAKRRGAPPLPSGICGGLCFFVLCLLITALKSDSQLFSAITIKLAICSLAGGVFGAMLSTKKKKKKR